ncbi:protein PIN-LIKES 5-like isoform X1 [Asparagus officinalis]|uniref:protein PIN-LIKES 5-like isoform X1 n=2 Tax=Asparagus officinalis TaxID=4686 RepID=UPI00098DF673|nr:protein PIN-LIKES 5-like isoform X1 [Asparagus officinalis]
MDFFSLLVVALMPVLQLLLICLVGAILASESINILPPSARKYTNKIVFSVFAPALIFGSLAKTITAEEIISWWFMPVNIGFTFLIGGSLGWVAVKILRPEKHLEGLIIANCSAGNLGYMLLLIIPAVCKEDESPFGDSSICTTRGLAYNALSMALGGLYIWTHTYSLMKNAGAIIERSRTGGVSERITLSNSDADMESHLIEKENEEVVSTSSMKAEDDRTIVQLLPNGKLKGKIVNFWGKIHGSLHLIVEELMAPPTIAAISGFIVGVVPWLKSLIIGSTAPFRVIEDSLKLLGDGTIPCNILILGANLTNGLRRSTLPPFTILSIIIVRYIALPSAGILVVKGASKFGFLPQDPLYQYVLLLQFALPPATAIGIMAELFDVGQQEYSVIFLWTYLVYTLALTFWSTAFMYILA